jgi:hypothetical protein
MGPGPGCLEEVHAPENLGLAARRWVGDGEALTSSKSWFEADRPS